VQLAAVTHAHSLTQLSLPLPLTRTAAAAGSLREERDIVDIVLR